MKNSLLPICASLCATLVSGLACADQFSAKSILENDDGSVTIEQPVYQIRNDGQILPISSSESNLNGICGAFGLGQNLFVFDHSSGASAFAVVNARGTFEKSMSRGELRDADAARTQVTEIICTLDNSTRLSRTSVRAQEIVALDYGSVRIMSPSFGTIQGKTRLISEFTNLAGVCRLYGFDHLTSEGAKISKSRDRSAVLLTRDGHFNGLSGESGGTIDSIACEGALLYKLDANFHPEGLNKTLLGIAYAAKPILANYMTSVAQNLSRIAPIEQSDSRMFKDPTRLSPSDYLRLLELELLQPVFDAMTSEWFENEVRPELNRERSALQAAYGYRGANDLCRREGALELILYHVVASIDAMSKEVSSLEAEKWLVSLKGHAGKLLASTHKTEALNDFVTAYTQGAELLTEVRTNRSLEGLAGTLEQSCELLKELR